MKKITIGGMLLIIGVFIDRILYHLIYLPRIGKAFSLYVGLDDLIEFYKWPFSWIGLFLIFFGMLLFLIRD